ncbi:MAG: DUF1295 domain-containing protein [Candidatus Nezhaarchaeota archaeon]|nr:DUF1295 domain-containing protein [Candidatus Nezhaarchaeota archaeon]
MALAKGHGRELAVAVMLSAVFTAALFYLTFDATRALDEALHVYFPEVFFDSEAAEKMLSTLRPIGYTALATTITLMALGFAARKRSLALLGSLAIYLPTFGYFAFAMFLLAGLGALRALWLPMLELSPTTLKLGCIAYLPFTSIPSAPLIGVVITCLGLFVSTLGTATWLYGRFRGHELVDFWIYKYSRHPQYLGFILWSYGLLIYVSYKPYVRGAFTTPPALIWLISTMVVMGVALLEEMEMTKKHRERYGEYCRRTPFMMPLPKPLAKVIEAPMKVIGGWPKSVKGIIATLALYTAILIAISYALLVAFRL